MKKLLWRALLVPAMVIVLFASCSADRKPLPPVGYSYCGYCDGTGYEDYYLGGLWTEECDACFGSGYCENLKGSMTSPSFRGNDDGPCHYCGAKKCPYFRAKSGADPTICKCGHSKRSHIDKY